MQRRRVDRAGRVGCILALAAASTLLVGPAGATTPTQVGTVTRSATATFTLGDSRNTTVSVTPTVVQDNTANPAAPPTVTRTLTSRLEQHYCDRTGAQDLWVDLVMNASLVDTKEIEAFENGYQQAEGDRPVRYRGTLTKTPMYHNGTCAAPTGPSWTTDWDFAATVGDVDFDKDTAAPIQTTLTDSDADSAVDTFTWTRGAVAHGQIVAKDIGLKAKLLAGQTGGTAVLSVVAHAVDGSDPSTMFAIKP